MRASSCVLPGTEASTPSRIRPGRQLCELLRQVAGPRPAHQLDLSAVGLQTTRQHLEERRLAGSVRPDEAGAIARPEHEARAIEQHLVSEAQREAARDEERHGGYPAGRRSAKANPPRSSTAPRAIGTGARNI